MQKVNTVKSNKILTATLYCYVEPHIATYAKKKGRNDFGSFSAYVNYLIAKDCNDAASMKKMKDMATKFYGNK